MNKKVFHVSRFTKTGKGTSVGDFDTVEQAKAAMLEHYKSTPKRGRFGYSITEEEIEEINGYAYRTFSMVISGGNRPYYKRFMADELKALAT